MTKLKRGRVFKYQQDDGLGSSTAWNRQKDLLTFRPKGLHQESYWKCQEVFSLFQAVEQPIILLPMDKIYTV